MSSLPSSPTVPKTDAAGLSSPVPRRSFLRYSGAGLALGGLYLAGCSKDDTTTNGPSSGLIDVGTGDTGILNYAYALEQLEAAFYTQVLAGAYYAGASAAEKAVFADLQAHEVIHRDFFKMAITTGRITDALVPDFTSIDFSQRTTTTAGKLGVLQAAMAFEDLGVAAYNGAGRFITSATYLTLAGKIVSVEARHAAVIRELLTTNTFVGSDVVDTTMTGLEKSKRPQVVLATANTFLMAGSKLSATNYPS